MKTPLLFLISCYLFTASCVKVESPQPVPDYSVYGVISPNDEYIRIFVGKTFGIDEPFSLDSMKYLPDAAVTLTSEGTSKTLKLNATTKEYEVLNDGFLRENKTYTLTILTGDDIISAITTIPKAPKLTLDKSETAGNAGQVRVSWDKTIDGRPAYYRLTGTADFNSPFTPYFYWDSSPYLWKTENKNSNGSRIESPLGNFDFSKDTEAEVMIELESLDYALFDFKEKLDAVQVRTDFTKKFEAPIYFASTVKNAVGVFSSSSTSQITFKLKKP